MPVITLKIDVDTYRGTKEGVPNLVRLLQAHEAGATFLFSLGPDHTGWAMRRVFRPGFFSKVSRTSVLEHYGLKTLLYGTLLPAPDIGKKCATQMRMVKEAGFECGVHTWDHVTWQDSVRGKDSEWTRHQIEQSWKRFNTIFGENPHTHGAAGWQMNAHAFDAIDETGICYASDTRAQLTDVGTLLDVDAGPYRLTHDGKTYQCIQLPTTLPTMDELLGCTIHDKVITTKNISQTILDITASKRDHVFTLHAELEGQKLAPVFQELLIGWRDQGYDCVSMEDFYNKIKDSILPVHPISWGQVPGRSGDLLVDKM